MPFPIRLSSVAAPFAVVAVMVGLTIGSAAADAPFLQLPIDCVMGERCVVQNYVDHDPGPDRRDYACGRLSYDGHTGTDIRLPDHVAMREGVAVLAAAAGVVRATRDGMVDVDMRQADPATLKNQGGGNSVVLDHGDGWQTIYGHFRQGSVAVKPGDRVEAGQRLGLVGLSGLTVFPHVHFEVRHGNRVIDPFVGPDSTPGDGAACNTSRSPLWSAEAAAGLVYRETAGLVAGFATDRPDAEQARRGAYQAAAVGRDSANLIFWADVMGVLAGDEAWFRIVGSNGRVLSERMTALTASNVSWFGFSGVKRPPDGWMPGGYRAVFRLVRQGKAVVEMERRLDIR